MEYQQKRNFQKTYNCYIVMKITLHNRLLAELGYIIIAIKKQKPHIFIKI